MLAVISPAKNLDYDTPTPTKKHTKAVFLDQSQELIDKLKNLAPHDISALMGISDKLGILNYDRFQQWALPFTTKNARQAVFAFNGDVYAGLDAYQFDENELKFAQDHLRILSGLYGLLKPLDLTQPYRLEMGTKFETGFETGEVKDLYAFWGTSLTDALNKQLKKLKTDTLLNLASNEYFKSVQAQDIQANIVTPVFKDLKNGQYKIISFFAKKARGRMSAYIIKNRLTDAAEIAGFDWDGYSYNEALSNEKNWVFTRDDAR